MALSYSVQAGGGGSSRYLNPNEHKHADAFRSELSRDRSVVSRESMHYPEHND